MLLCPFLMKFLCFILTLIFINTAIAENFGSQTGLKLPRYVSLKSNDSNIRVGPSKNYPIRIKYISENFPLKIVEEHNDWRRIIDYENNQGWIHKSLIKRQRNAIIQSESNETIYIFNIPDGKVIGEIDLKLIVNLDKCKLRWCLITKNNHKGWINKKYLWGVEKDEEFNIGILQKFVDYYFRSLNILEKLLQ